MITRRELIAGGSMLAACAGAHPRDTHASGGDDVSAVEDLMREHGLLERVLGIYAACARQIRAGEREARGAIREAAAIARTFVEDYHERLEERFVFPQLIRTELAALVAVLRDQHDAGRRLTARIDVLAASALRDDGDARELSDALDGYATMFRPHAAREDTVVFPRLRAVMGKAYDELGDRFEDEERARFGAGGFAGVVVRVAGIESELGLDDLRIYTTEPHAPAAVTVRSGRAR
jgi:hemerythrin-like domain-containing protein